MGPQLLDKVVPFGALVDFDLRQSPEWGEELRRLFGQYGLLVFRGQQLTQAEQIAFVGEIGPVLDHFSMINYVSNNRADGYLGDSELNFHSDASFYESPALAISLHALEVEEAGNTSTKLANGILALERLPTSLRRRIDSLSALHLFAVTDAAFADRQKLDDYPESAPRAVHPVVMRDPMTAKETLYVPRVNTALILGMTEAESGELLEELQGYLYDPDNVYDHFWNEGDVIIWSNIGLHHARGRHGGGVRTLQRVCSSDASFEMYESMGGFRSGKQ